MKNIIILGLLSLTILSCEESTDESIDTPEVTLESLKAMRNEIIAIAESETCEDSADWKWTAFGFKACGGPEGYLAYSTAIDESAFLKKVSDYTTAKEKYDIENNLASDCRLEIEPKGIICKEGEPVFTY
ncbi:MAG: hypothetical protein JXR10_05775 [Cyclobacteriaceae bacterium]